MSRTFVSSPSDTDSGLPSQYLSAKDFYRPLIPLKNRRLERPALQAKKAMLQTSQFTAMKSICLRIIDFPWKGPIAAQEQILKHHNRHTVSWQACSSATVEQLTTTAHHPEKNASKCLRQATNARKSQRQFSMCQTRVQHQPSPPRGFGSLERQRVWPLLPDHMITASTCAYVTRERV